MICDKGFPPFNFGVWLALLGQLVCCECCGYYFAWPIHNGCLKMAFF